VESKNMQISERTSWSYLINHNKNSMPVSASVLAGAAIFASTGSVYSLDRVDAWLGHVQPRVHVQLTKESTEATLEHLTVDLRAIPEHIDNIKNSLQMGMSDVARTLGVTRQAAYKWLSGTATPENESKLLILKLSRLSDVFKKEGLIRTGDLARAKVFGGNSIIDLILSNSDTKEHTASLIREGLKLQQHEDRVTQDSINRNTPRNDWLNEQSIPSYENDQRTLS
jgi:DNA-binding transcriptional regulator YiaG